MVQRASASLAASLSSSDFGRAAKGSIPKTWSDRVGAMAGACFSNTPSGVSSTISRVPASRSRRLRIAAGSCPLVETVAIRGSVPCRKNRWDKPGGSENGPKPCRLRRLDRLSAAGGCRAFRSPGCARRSGRAGGALPPGRAGALVGPLGAPAESTRPANHPAGTGGVAGKAYDRSLAFHSSQLGWPFMKPSICWRSASSRGSWRR